MPHPFLEAREKVSRMRRESNLLEAVDSFAAKGYLLNRSVDELDEYTQEQEKHGTPEYDLAATQGEFDDIAVLFFSWLETYARDVDMLQTVHTANGYGSHSAALENLAPVILDSQDDLRAVPEVVARLASIGIHMPVPYVTFARMSQTVERVLKNRPPWLYSTYCPILKRELRDEELLLKYEHLEKGTKMIRKKVDRTLRTMDLLPHKQQLLEWQKSDIHLEHIAAALEDGGRIVVSSEKAPADGR